MVTADDVIAWFDLNVGLKEQPVGSNCNWISRWFWEQTGRHSALAPGCYAWCAVTVSRALNEAWGDPDVWQVPGIQPDWRPGFSYVPSVRRAFENAGRYLGQGERGDLVIFDWDGDDWGDHVGVFLERVDADTCLVWEGNTADSDISLRRRPFSLIAGFCRPPYDKAPNQEDDMFDDDDRAALQKTQAVVEHLERWGDLAEPGEHPGGLAHTDVMARLGAIEADVKALRKGGAGGGSIDLDTLAEKVAALIGPKVAAAVAADLAERLQE